MSLPHMAVLCPVVRGSQDCGVAQVRLVQMDNLSWFGYPNDVTPSVRNLAPGLEQVRFARRPPRWLTGAAAGSSLACHCSLLLPWQSETVQLSAHQILLQEVPQAELDQLAAAEAAATAAQEAAVAQQHREAAPPDAARHFRPAVGEGLAPQVGLLLCVWLLCFTLMQGKSQLASELAVSALQGLQRLRCPERIISFCGTDCGDLQDLSAHSCCCDLTAVLRAAAGCYGSAQRLCDSSAQGAT